MKAPCVDCDKRHIGCHGSCDDYKEWKAEVDQKRIAKQTALRSRYEKPVHVTTRSRTKCRKK